MCKNGTFVAIRQLFAPWEALTIDQVSTQGLEAMHLNPSFLSNNTSRLQYKI